MDLIIAHTRQWKATRVGTAKQWQGLLLCAVGNGRQAGAGCAVNQPTGTQVALVNQQYTDTSTPTHTGVSTQGEMLVLHGKQPWRGTTSLAFNTPPVSDSIP
eukprot:1158731-Pelagomonas_calceolata.AAC.9